MNIREANVIIVDDDTDFCEILCVFLDKIGVTSITMAHTYEEGKALIESTKPNVLLLDIDLGSGGNGIQLGTHARKVLPHAHIVYFTNNYKGDIFEATKPIQPAAFLDKELDELKIRQAIELALLMDKEDVVDIPSPAIGSHLKNEFIFVKIGSIFKKVMLDEIDYIIYSDRYANLVVNNKKIPLNTTMRDLAKNLPINKFVQIHQSYIANINKIAQVNLVNNQLEISNKQIPIGASFKKALQDRLVLLT